MSTKDEIVLEEYSAETSAQSVTGAPLWLEQSAVPEVQELLHEAFVRGGLEAYRQCVEIARLTAKNMIDSDPQTQNELSSIQAAIKTCGALARAFEEVMEKIIQATEEGEEG